MAEDRSRMIPIAAGLGVAAYIMVVALIIAVGIIARHAEADRQQLRELDQRVQQLEGK